MKSQSGQSLVQVLVSVAIMGVILTAMSTMFGSLNREARSMSEKLGAMDLEKLLIGSLYDGSACVYALNHPTPIVFNAAATVSQAAPLLIPLPSTPAAPARLYSSHNPAATPALGPVVVEVGQQASPYSSSLVISAIGLEITGISGPNIVGRWRIDFDNTRMVRPLKPAYVSVALRADITTPGAAKFTSCQITSIPGSGPGGNGEWCGTFVSSQPDGGIANGIDRVVMPCKGKVLACPPGYSPYTPPPNPLLFGAATAPPCKGGTYAMTLVGYDTSTACPAGYSLKVLFTYVSNYTPGTYNPGGGGTVASVSRENLLTCTGN